MTVSLAWLLSRRDLDLRHLTGPADGVEIAWAHSVELADPTPWLTGGELVLTTGLRLPDAARELDAYVERLSSVGVAALAFGAGVRLHAPPPALVVACKKHSLPLIEVPLPTPFVAITRAVADELSRRQTEGLRRSVDHQKRATLAALRRGVPGVVDVLHQELGVQAALLDEHGRVIAESPESASLVAAVRRRRKRSGDGKRIGNLIFDGKQGVIELQSVPGRIAGRGTFAVAAATQLDNSERVLLNQAVSLMSLLMDRPEEVLDARREVGGITFGLLVAQPDQAVGLLPGFGIRADETIRVLWIPAPDQELPARIAHALADLGLPHLVAEREDDEVDAHGVAVLVRAVDAEPAAQAIAERLHLRPGVVGIGRETRPNRTSEALDSARQALHATRGREAITRFDDLTLRSVLRDDVVRGRLTALVPAPLMELLESDSSRDREMVASLSAYLQHNGVADPAARARGVHRHTLRSHVRRLEELTGLSFDDPETRTMTHLALLSRSSAQRVAGATTSALD